MERTEILGDQDHQIDWLYPDINSKDRAHLYLGLMHVRAADRIRISYDGNRDGWKIEQASRFSWDTTDTVADSDWKEVAFIRAWARETFPIKVNGDIHYVRTPLTRDQLARIAGVEGSIVATQEGVSIPQILDEEELRNWPEFSVKSKENDYTLSGGEVLFDGLCYQEYHEGKALIFLNNKVVYVEEDDLSYEDIVSLSGVADPSRVEFQDMILKPGDVIPMENWGSCDYFWVEK